MCDHEWKVGLVVVEDECNEAGDLLVFGGKSSDGEPGAVCELCALLFGTEGEYHKTLLYTIKVLEKANFPKNVGQ